MTGAHRQTSLPHEPDPRQMDRMASIRAPLRPTTQPKVLGIDRIPDRSALFVGNHTRYSFLDLPFMMTELWKRRRIIVRGLGDHGHYAIPIWRDLLEMGGMVRGTRANVRALMRDGQDILGVSGRSQRSEVSKDGATNIGLIWKERIGSARLAIEFGYPIVPFAAVGAEEMFHVLLDRGMPIAAQVSAVMHRLVGLPRPPIPRGIGPTFLPRGRSAGTSGSAARSRRADMGGAGEQDAAGAPCATKLKRRWKEASRHSSPSASVTLIGGCSRGCGARSKRLPNSPRRTRTPGWSYAHSKHGTSRESKVPPHGSRAGWS